MRLNILSINVSLNHIYSVLYIVVKRATITDKRICDNYRTSLFLIILCRASTVFFTTCLLESNSFIVVIGDEHKKESRDKSRI